MMSCVSSPLPIFICIAALYCKKNNPKISELLLPEDRDTHPRKTCSPTGGRYCKPPSGGGRETGLVIVILSCAPSLILIRAHCSAEAGGCSTVGTPQSTSNRKGNQHGTVLLPTDGSDARAVILLVRLYLDGVSCQQQFSHDAEHVNYMNRNPTSNLG